MKEKEIGNQSFLFLMEENMNYNLERFVIAQQRMYAYALEEIKSGRKITHWMWFIFPQLKYLGTTEKALYYGIQNLEEAQAYLEHEILGNRLIEITKELLKLPTSNAYEVLGFTDAMKLKSCMTLFFYANPDIFEFQQVLEKYFKKEEDERTVRMLKNHSSK